MLQARLLLLLALVTVALSHLEYDGSSSRNDVLRRLKSKKSKAPKGSLKEKSPKASSKVPKAKGSKTPKAKTASKSKAPESTKSPSVAMKKQVDKKQANGENNENDKKQTMSTTSSGAMTMMITEKSIARPMMMEKNKNKKDQAPVMKVRQRNGPSGSGEDQMDAPIMASTSHIWSLRTEMFKKGKEEKEKEEKKETGGDGTELPDE